MVQWRFLRSGTPAHHFTISPLHLMEYLNFKLIAASVIYSLLGIMILVISFIVIEKLTPQMLWKEIIEEHNTALAIVAGAFIIAVAMIISSAIHG
jgi:uncharacterized membrane protein YjfL (UPF0719 family)